MIKHTKIIVPLVAVAFMVSVFAASQVVRAEDDTSTETTNSETQQSAKERAAEQAKKLQELREKAAEKRTEALKKAEELRQKQSEAEKERQNKRHEAFKNACENRRQSYQNRLKNIDTRLTKHVEVLDKIVARVQAFVDKKDLTVPQYAALLAEVQTQRQLATDLHDTLKEKAAAFDCGNTPDEAKAALAAFKDALEQEIDALKAYKTAVKNLIVAVKTTAGGSNDENN